MTRTPCDRRGLTLIELLVCMAIVAIVFALLTSAVQRVREAAHRTHCQNNLRQIGLALSQYHDSNRVLPPACSTKKNNLAYLSWSARILPWLEQEPLWRETQTAFASDGRFSSAPHRAVRTTVVGVFICPSHGQQLANPQPENWLYAVTHYLGVAGSTDDNGTLFGNSRIRFADITDGLSNTVLVGERPPSTDERFGWWYAGIGQGAGSLDSHLSTRQNNRTFRAPTCHFGPYSYQDGSASNLCDMFHFWSMHPQGANFVFADGSVRFLPYSAAPILSDLATRAGKERVTLDP